MSEPELLAAEHYEAIANLFAVAFNAALDPALWRWKYAPGHGIGWGIWQQTPAGRRLVAHFGGFIRRAWYRQKPIMVLQLGDVMAEPTAASHLAPRQRPIAYLARYLLTTLIGPGRPYPIGYGFPNNRHYRYFARLGYYAAAGTISQATSLAASTPPIWHPLPIKALEEPRRRRWLAAVVRNLARHHLILDRTPETYRYRYHDHPEQRYRLWWHPRLPALAVTAPCREMPQTHLELLDLVAHRHAFAAAWQEARTLAHATGHTHLTAWVSDAIAPLLAPHATLTPLGVTIPTNALVPYPTGEALQWRWWLMGGDSDFR
jgi:hypothetical protein